MADVSNINNPGMNVQSSIEGGTIEDINGGSFDVNSTPDNPTPDNPTNDTDKDARIAELERQLAKAELDGKKNKAALDKALKEKGDITKELREKMTEAQRAQLEKEEADEEQKKYVSDLELYKQRNEAIKRYMSVPGMTMELAEKAADAELDKDSGTDFATVMEEYYTTRAKKEKEDAIKKRSQPNVGDGNYPKMTKEQILAIKDTSERQKAIAQHLDLFS